MKWLLIATCCLSTGLLLGGVLAFVYGDETKPYFDSYANRAGVFGFFVSVVGFVLTVWAIFETLRVTRAAQKEIQVAAIEARTETRGLLEKIRIKMFEDTCDQALLFASEARYAIRSGSWLRAAERCDDARQLAARLLMFTDLSKAESDSIREIIDDLRTSIAYLERYKIGRKNVKGGMLEEKRRPVDALIDELERLRARLQNQLLEVSDAD